MGRLPRAEERARSITENGATCPNCGDISSVMSVRCESDGCNAWLVPRDLAKRARVKKPSAEQIAELEMQLRSARKVAREQRVRAELWRGRATNRAA